MIRTVTELECGDAQVGHGQRCLGCVGFSFAAQKLAADSLELLTHVQLASIEVDHVPGEPEQLALAQTEDEDQDVSGVEHVIVATGGFEELTSLIDGP